MRVVVGVFVAVCVLSVVVGCELVVHARVVVPVTVVRAAWLFVEVVIESVAQHVVWLCVAFVSV